MSFEIITLYFDDAYELRNACSVHTVGRESTWHGSFATVYDLDDRVLKVSGGDDLGFLSYLETMMALNVSNRHLPVIHEVIQYRLTDEARKKVSMYKHQERIITYMEKLKQPPKFLRRVYTARGNLLKTWWPPVMKWAEIVTEHVHADIGEKFKDLSLEHQEAIVLLKIAHEHYQHKYPRDYHKFDLHAGNVLARGKTFVITDPLA